MTFQELKEKNPQIALYPVDSEEFRSFGRVLQGFDAAEILKTAKTIPAPDSGSVYVAREPRFEDLAIAKEITDRCFGELPTQIGYCWGHNSFLNATEWHTSSEINIAITPLVLVLGHRWDIRDGWIDAADFKAFYLPAGTVAEVYATSLHFCPCEVEPSGFGCVVALPEGTNTPLSGEAADKLLFCKNKWLLAHCENTGLIARGAVAGIRGVNYRINY